MYVKKIKVIFLFCLQNTSKLIQSDQWSSLDEAAIMKIYNQVSWQFIFYTIGSKRLHYF
jgi:hypothetical protein